MPVMDRLLRLRWFNPLTVLLLSMHGPKRIWFLGIWLNLLLSLAGCERLAWGIEQLADSSRASLPPCVDDNCNCGDFRDQVSAQQVLEAFSADPYDLDRDVNGQACEQLPNAVAALDPAIESSQNIHLRLGNPSNASANNLNNFLIERRQYALSYDHDRGVPNWVSWQLDADWLGEVERQDDFRSDDDLPQGWYPVTPEDYQGSGYDRGHVVPSGDRTANTEDNSATFLMTNIIPQTPENNRGPWRELEEYARNLLNQPDIALYITAGAYGDRGQIGDGKVTVPSRLWKVIVVLDQPEVGVEGVSIETEVIAVDMPNRRILRQNWRSYQTSIDRIEVATGYDLLAHVPEQVQTVIEARESNF